MNQELRALFEEDQADRRGEFPADMYERDQHRRRRVEELLAQATLTDPDDLFHAAMVFQHGGDRAYYLRAHELAKRAAELGSTRPARWLAAAAYDRWLMTSGLPQKYGTQYRSANDRWVLHEVDPTTHGRGARPLGCPGTGRGAAAGVGAAMLQAGMPDAHGLGGDTELTSDLGLADTGGEQLGRSQPAGLELLALLLCRRVAGHGWHTRILTRQAAQLQPHRPSTRHPRHFLF